MKITHVIASLGMGGAETLDVQVAARQAGGGHDVSSVILLDRREVNVSVGVRILAVGDDRHAGIGRFGAIWRLAQTLKALQS